MSGRKRKRQIKVRAAELNIMPFIDIFSMLNTFLLVSASFVNIGILTVQIPFLTNAPPPKDKPQRSFSINVNVEKDKAELETKFSAEPVDRKTQEYKLDKDGLKSMHQELVKLRVAQKETDTVTVFSEDDVTYDNLVKVLDSIKALEPTDPPITIMDERLNQPRRSIELYEKVVLGSVIL